MDAAALPKVYDARKESYEDMNDWLNVLVKKRIAKAQDEGEPLSAEMAWVAEHDHEVYVKRFKPMVLVVLALCLRTCARIHEM